MAVKLAIRLKNRHYIVQENTTLTNMNTSISDHSMLVLNDHLQEPKANKSFKFINCSVYLDNFEETVKNIWNMPLEGRPMFVVWKKLQRLQPHIKKLSNTLSDISSKIAQAREKMFEAQNDLVTDIMNVENIEKVKENSEDLLNWQDMEESMLKKERKSIGLDKGMETISTSMPLSS